MDRNWSCTDKEKERFKMNLEMPLTNNWINLKSVRLKCKPSITKTELKV